MRKLVRLCRRLARRIDRYFVVTVFPGRRFVVHEYDRDIQDCWTLGEFRRVSDVERFLLDKFNH